jgi:hypothetical protein
LKSDIRYELFVVAKSYLDIQSFVQQLLGLIYATVRVDLCFHIGCIQALRCNKNQCPTGVATQDKILMKGLVVADKSERVYHFHKNTLHAANELLATAGKKSFADVDINIFMRGDEFAHLSDLYFPDNLKIVRKH